MKLRRTSYRGFVALAGALLASASLAGPAQAVGPITSDDNPISALVVVSADTNDTINICRSWGSRSGDKCASNSAMGSLTNGQSSKTKYGWADTDGIKLPAHSKLWHTDGADTIECTNTGSSSKWCKVSPALFGSTRHYQIRPA